MVDRETNEGSGDPVMRCAQPRDPLIPHMNAQERTRTSTGFYSHQHLKLTRLPIPPPGPCCFPLRPTPPDSGQEVYRDAACCRARVASGRQAQGFRLMPQPPRRIRCTGGCRRPDSRTRGSSRAAGGSCGEGRTARRRSARGSPPIHSGQPHATRFAPSILAIVHPVDS
jgi:hypothetical protein